MSIVFQLAPDKDDFLTFGDSTPKTFLRYEVAPHEEADSLGIKERPKTHPLLPLSSLTIPSGQYQLYTSFVPLGRPKHVFAVSGANDVISTSTILPSASLYPQSTPLQWHFERQVDGTFVIFNATRSGELNGRV
jgi:hypothetical protein